MSTELIPPQDIDASFVARPVCDVTSVDIGSEVVLVRGARQAMVVNATGSLVWRCLDGQTNLDTLIGDISDELAIDREVVRDDVVPFVRQLGAVGLLEGVGNPAPEFVADPDLVFTSPTVPETGDAVDAFALVDEGGRSRAAADHSGHEVLLVSWSATCGFCTMIADQLASMQDALSESDVDLVFVTRGDIEENRRALEGAGIRAPVLRPATGADDPFAGLGTPTAYRLDARGRLAAPAALGALHVPQLMAEAAGMPAAPAPVGGAPGDDDGVRYLPVSGGMCGPGGGSNAANTTEWRGLRAYRVDGHHVGVQFNSEPAALLLDALFDGARVDDPRAAASYSVALFDDASSSSRQLNLLVRSGQQLVRSRSAARVLRALMWRLAIDIASPTSTTEVLIAHATAAVRGHEAVLLPPDLWQWNKQLQPRFARLGVALADVPLAEVDLRTRELVVRPPAIHHAAEVLAELDETAHLGSEPHPVMPGRYTLLAWVLPREPEHSGALSPAHAALAALPYVVRADHETRDTIERLGTLFGDVEGRGFSFETATAVVDAAKSVFR